MNWHKIKQRLFRLSDYQVALLAMYVFGLFIVGLGWKDTMPHTFALLPEVTAFFLVILFVFVPIGEWLIGLDHGVNMNSKKEIAEFDTVKRDSNGHLDRKRHNAKD